MSKYGAVKQTRVVGDQVYTFDSRAEAEYFDLLMISAKRGSITELKLQPSYTIEKAYRIDTTKTKSGKSKIGNLSYTPDFEYIDKNGEKVAVEVKGYADTAFKLRQKLFMAIGWEEHGVSRYVVVYRDRKEEYELKTVEKIK